MSRSIRVVIADDNQIVRLGLEQLLGTVPDIEILASAVDGAQAVEFAHRLKPDLCLLDVRMPGMSGVEAAAALAPDFKVVMLTHSEDSETVLAALRAGAHGYVVYSELDTDFLSQALQSVMAGGMLMSPTASTAVLGASALHSQHSVGQEQNQHAARPGTETGVTATLDAPSVAGTPCGPERFDLSRREVEVMDLVAQGLTNREIAEAFFLSEKTVKNHINRIFSKMAVESRAAAVSRWLGRS